MPDFRSLKFQLIWATTESLRRQPKAKLQEINPSSADGYNRLSLVLSVGARVPPNPLSSNGVYPDYPELAARLRPCRI